MSGRVRDFSEAKRLELIGYTEVNGGFFSFNWLTDIQYWFADVSLADDMSNIDQYHKDVIDKKNTNIEKINAIFRLVETTDNNYSLTFGQNREILESYNALAKSFAESIGDVSFPDSFDVNSFVNITSYYYDKLTLFQWEQIMDKPWDQISAQEYEKLARMMLTTKDPKILEAMIQKCYDVGGEVATYIWAFKGTPTYLFGENPKLKILASCMQVMTNSLLLDAENVDPLIKASLIDNKTLETAIQNTQLMQALMLYSLPPREYISSGDYTPGIKLNVEKDGSYTVSIDTTYFYETQMGVEYKTTYGGKSHTLTITRPAYGDTADEINKKQYKQFISSLVGLSTEDYLTTFGESAVGVAGLFATGPVGTFVFGAEAVYSALLGPIQKILDQANYDKTTQIGNIGVVADSFNLYYVSSGVDGSNSNFSFSLYPTISTNEVPSTAQCVKNFNDHLFKDPEYDSLRIKLETEGYLQKGQGLSLDTVLADPQKASAILAIAVDDGYDITKLTNASVK